MRRSALLLAALLPLTACDDGAAIDPGVALTAPTLDALALLPSGATTVAMFDVQEADEAGALGDALEQMGRASATAQARFEDFERSTGFDPARDLDRVYFAFTDDVPLFVVRAQMDRERLIAFLDEQPEMTRSAYRDLPLFTAAESDGEAFVVALLSNDLALAGSASDVRAAADRALDGGASAATDAEFTALLSRARHDEAWMVNRGSVGPGADFDLASGVISMDFDADGVDVAAVAEPGASASADDLADAIEGMIALARVESRGDAEMRDLLDGVSVRARGGLVEVQGALSSQYLDKMHAH